MIQLLCRIRQKRVTDNQLTNRFVYTLRIALLEILGFYNALKGQKQQHRASLYVIRIFNQSPEWAQENEGYGYN